MIIYKAENRINGKIYIGQTTASLKKRIAGHLWETHKNQVFSNALRKYGIQSFNFSIIDSASSQEVLDATLPQKSVYTSCTLYLIWLFFPNGIEVPFLPPSCIL